MEARTQRPFAVVTGASSGIGFEIARVLGQEGFDLLIAAEDDGLESARQDLEQLTSVESTQLNLADEDNVAAFHNRISNDPRPVDTLVMNAGISAGGSFAGGTALQDELDLIDLNVRSTVHLCKLEIEPMIRRDQGRILFSTSVASTVPGSYQAVYNAARSFLRSFAKALAEEVQGTGVSVSFLMTDSLREREHDLER